VYSTSRKARGFTLVELLVVISVLGIILAFFVPTIVGRVTTNARRVATLQEMRMIRDAIAGDPDVRFSGEMVAMGFRNDMGRYPRSLVELATKNPFLPPWSGENYMPKEILPDWDPYIKKGWNGPYVREDGNMGYLDDAWGAAYRYFPATGTETLGLWSAGANGLFYGVDPGIQDSDDIVVMF
jgi:prepilin-type N-terminal cleavage/methylation domain-containing protein